MFEVHHVAIKEGVEASIEVRVIAIYQKTGHQLMRKTRQNGTNRLWSLMSVKSALRLSRPMAPPERDAQYNL